jgi:hypothetical protein
MSTLSHPAELDAFSQSYREARAKFLDAAAAAGLAVQSEPHPLPGADGEPLAIDVVRDGAPEAERVLLLSSGCHGVEGYCGSGVQVALLRDAGFRAALHASGVALVHVHAINPFGFSHMRRATHENVDLNRNFHDFSRPLPRNPAYAALHPLLLPARWPPGWGNRLAIAALILRKGLRTLQQAVSGGQYEHADGLFFGGTAPAWSNQALRRILRREGARARRIGWIDLHTGLGKQGACERGFAARADDHAAYARAQAWWGGAGATPISRLGQGDSVSAALSGLMWGAVYDECPQAEVTAIAMEFGTEPLLTVLHALRGEQWLWNHREGGVRPEQAAALRRALREAFYTDTPQWKAAILAQAREAVEQGVLGLSQCS